MASLDSIETALQALSESVDRRFDAQDRSLAGIAAHLDALNGRTRTNEACVARLQEQSNVRAALLTGVSVVMSAIAVGVAKLIG